MRRRDFLSRAALATIGAATGSSLWARAGRACMAVGGPGPYGPLQAADANGLQLPFQFTSTIIARGGQVVGETGHVWHRAADGGATFRVPGGYVYVSNSELNSGAGGVGALRFDHRGRIQDAYSICSGTSRNCAGGPTPWGTWLTCEEVSRGIVYECDPTGVQAAVARPALGTYNHEAVAVDPERRRLYLTEDRSNGNFYRFTPTTWGDLSEGLLEVAVGTTSEVSWAEVPNPNPASNETSTRNQVPGALDFNGGEGIVWQSGVVHFTTKGDNRVWRYEPRTETMEILYQYTLDPALRLSGVDNIAATRSGDLIVAEDPGNLELVLLTPDCVASPLVRVTGQGNTELTGPALDPLGRRLYFSSQRGGGGGITYQVTGPFRRL
ncbi:MAG: alkaline phosphatase PhoX [Myxococcota bacterium]|nr:alkaline phosphatase PhoX [Myxococcota bacterium]